VSREYCVQQFTNFKKLAMKKSGNRYLLILGFVAFQSITACAQNPVNWTEKQVIQPAELAATITTGKDLPLIFSVGPAATIPGSVAIGMVNTAEGIDKFKTFLKTADRKKKIVIYCGCCPYDHCPNVRPAIDAMKQMKFTNFFLLDLPHNIKKDWIDKGYPNSKS
jgi:hypothetical protein